MENNPDPLLQELLSEFDLNWAEDDVPRLREYARNKLTSAVLRTRERVVEEAMSVVPEACYYDCRAATLEALTALKETNPSTL